MTFITALLALALPAAANEAPRSRAPDKPSQELSDRWDRIDQDKVRDATGRLRERLGGQRMNIRPDDQITDEDWQGILDGLGEDDVWMMKRRYPDRAADIDRALGNRPQPMKAPPGGEADSRGPGRRGAGSKQPRRAKTAGGSADLEGSPSEEDAGGGSEAEGSKEEETADPAAKAAGAAKLAKSNFGADKSAAAAGKMQEMLGQKDSLFGPERKPEELPGGGAEGEAKAARKLPGSAAAAARHVGASRPPPSRSPGEAARAPAGAAEADAGAAPSSGDPALDAARRAIERFRSSGGETMRRRGPIVSSVPTPDSAAAAVRGRPAPAKTETPFGELSAEEQRELDAFLKMIDEVARTGALDSQAANASLVASESRAEPYSDFLEALTHVRAILERSGRTLPMDEQARVLDAARRLGFELNSRQAWNLLKALERGEPPPPRAMKRTSLWQRLVAWGRRAAARALRSLR